MWDGRINQGLRHDLAGVIEALNETVTDAGEIEVI
jgi:hypothetical protein